jgi:pyruvate/2-oxoglutarate dehydrogenase complex dihydrolipoamide acyltransferase (E2) component
MSKSAKLAGWRKIANALWDAPADPQIYGAMDLDATPVLELIESARARGYHLTPTHLVGRAVAHALDAVPDLNVRLVGDRAIARESIDIFFITAVASGHDLTGVKITGVDRKGVFEVGRDLAERSRQMKGGADPDFARSKRIMDTLPRPILRPVLRLAAWLTQDRAIGLPWLGLPASPFGSAMVSSVGMLGLPTGFTPLAWMYSVPLLVLVGEIAEKPVAISGQVQVRPMLPVTTTIDHRYVDGAQIAQALKAFRGYLAAPAQFEPTVTEGPRRFESEAPSAVKTRRAP